MRHDMEAIEERVRAKLGNTKLAPHLTKVTVQEGCDEEDTPFLRVILLVDNSEALDADDLLPIVEEVERDLIAYDDRFPSIRIADAA